ncbi:MAG TPA: hypothetical protein VKH81_02380 [Candidatus Angelobacter sp.]|nr:hypothetical protein [Candidatus Angelobacter sp.]
MTREEIIAAMKECVARLGRVPRQEEFRVTMQVRKHCVRKHFSTYTRLLSVCGLERHGSGVPLTPEAMYVDWATVVRNMGKIPTVNDYDRQGTYSNRPYMSRFRYWREVPAGMLAYMVEKGLGDEWQDVMNIIAEHLQISPEEATKYKLPSGSTFKPRILPDRPVYGWPFLEGPLTFAPTNEAGVLAAFACMARELGFAIQRLQTEFPDCEAMREVGRNKWQRLRIEIEYESRNFLEHMHPLTGCDLIVCWFDNWEGCPLEVIALSEAVSYQLSAISQKQRQNRTTDEHG